MTDETQPGRLAVWGVHGGSDELCLHIGPDGHVTTTLGKRFTEWLTAATMRS
jgi:hypothetical protein